MGLRDQWYENAVFYCLAIETYTDSGGDGTGGFTGLTRRWRSSSRACSSASPRHRRPRPRTASLDWEGSYDRLSKRRARLFMCAPCIGLHSRAESPEPLGILTPHQTCTSPSPRRSQRHDMIKSTSGRASQPMPACRRARASRYRFLSSAALPA